MKQVYVVDKSAAVQKLIEVALTREGFEVFTFNDGLSALDAAFKLPPDLWMLEKSLDGLDLSYFLQKLRQRESLKSVPIILLVTAAEQHDTAGLKALGIVHTIQKPLDPIEVVEKAKACTSGEAEAPPAPPSDRESIAESAHPSKAESQSPADPSDPAEEAYKGNDDDTVRIEELLGWTIAQEETVIADVSSEDTPPESMPLEIPESEISEKAEPEIVADLSSEGEPQDETFNLSAEDLFDKDQDVPMAGKPWSGFSSAQKSIEDLETIHEGSDGPAHETEVLQPAAPSLPRSVQELPAAKDLAEPDRPPAADTGLREKLSSESQRLIESVVWEVVPSLAETLLHENMHRLIEESVRKVAQETIEKIAWEVVPGLAEPVIRTRLQEAINQAVENAVRQIGQEMIEKIAWEVVPSLAEIAVQGKITGQKSHGQPPAN